MKKIFVIVTLSLMSLIAATVVRAVEVDGQVVNRDGVAQSQVKVELFSGDNLVYSAWTDGDGRFTIADVAEGPYQVKVDGRDKQYAVTVDGSGMHPNPLVVD